MTVLDTARPPVSTYSKPETPTETPDRLAPVDTKLVPENSATPFETTLPPARIVPGAEPPGRISNVPPEEIVTALAVPPEPTISSPPLLITDALSTPPE